MSGDKSGVTLRFEEATHGIRAGGGLRTIVTMTIVYDDDVGYKKLQGDIWPVVEKKLKEGVFVKTEFSLVDDVVDMLNGVVDDTSTKLKQIRANSVKTEAQLRHALAVATMELESVRIKLREYEDAGKALYQWLWNKV